MGKWFWFSVWFGLLVLQRPAKKVSLKKGTVPGEERLEHSVDEEHCSRFVT